MREGPQPTVVQRRSAQWGRDMPRNGGAVHAPVCPHVPSVWTPLRLRSLQSVDPGCLHASPACAYRGAHVFPRVDNCGFPDRRRVCAVRSARAADVGAQLLRSLAAGHCSPAAVSSGLPPRRLRRRRAGGGLGRRDTGPANVASLGLPETPSPSLGLPRPPWGSRGVPGRAWGEYAQAAQDTQEDLAAASRARPGARGAPQRARKPFERKLCCWGES